MCNLTCNLRNHSVESKLAVDQKTGAVHVSMKYTKTPKKQSDNFAYDTYITHISALDEFLSNFFVVLFEN